MKFDTINTESIHRLMDIFYSKVRENKEGLGDIFNSKIGTSDEEWNAHKLKIANFWQGMLLGSGDYNGQPLKAHLDLAPFPRELFDVWLRLFKESLESVYAREEDSLLILERAQMIAKRFQYMLYDNPHIR